MEQFVLLGLDQTRPLVMAAWRCATTMYGAPYVEVAGDLVLPQWCAVSLASQVSRWPRPHHVTPPISTVMQYDHTLVPPPPTSGYSSYNSSAQYGQGTGSILLYGLSCYGTESTLLYCYYYGSVVAPNLYCSHSQDASVTCYGSTSQPTSMWGYMYM